MVFGLALAVLCGALAILIFNHSAGTSFGLANDDFARLVMFGVIGLTIAAGIAQSGRHRFGTIARAALVWLALILGLVAAYGYRDNLVGVADRVQSLLVPGTPADGPEPGSITIAKSMDGHFRVRAMVDGRIVTMVVDTGASEVVLTERDAIAAGIDPAGLIYDARVSTANGETTAATIRIGTLAIGSIAEKNIRALVARPGSLQQSLLGMNFLNRLSSFTVERRQLVMRR
jgi:aspartyl protease family protein